VRLRMAWIFCLALLALQGCEGAFVASHSEGYLVYEPREDALRLVEIYLGLHATDDERAAAALSEFLAGRRVYPLEMLDLPDEDSRTRAPGGF
jgi:predicted aminopeptidase